MAQQYVVIGIIAFVIIGLTLPVSSLVYVRTDVTYPNIVTSQVSANNVPLFTFLSTELNALGSQQGSGQVLTYNYVVNVNGVQKTFPAIQGRFDSLTVVLPYAMLGTPKGILNVSVQPNTNGGEQSYQIG